MAEHDRKRPGQARPEDEQQESSGSAGSYEFLVGRLGPAGAQRAVQRRKAAGERGAETPAQVQAAADRVAAGAGGPPGGGAGARAVQRKPLVPKDAVDAKADDVNSDRGDQTKAAHLAEKDGANNPVGGGFRKVYQAGGLEVLAFLPEAGIDKPDDL